MTNDHPEPTSKDEWRDRLIDRALDELAGGQSPPDLSEPIVAARAASQSDVATLSSSGELVMPTESSARAARLRTLALAASLLLNFGLAAWMLRSHADGEGPVADRGRAISGESVEELQKRANVDLKALEESIMANPAVSGSLETEIRIVDADQLASAESTEFSVLRSESLSRDNLTTDLRIVDDSSSLEGLVVAGAGVPVMPAPNDGSSDGQGRQASQGQQASENREGQGLYSLGMEGRRGAGFGGGGRPPGPNSVEGLQEGEQFPGFTADLDVPYREQSFAHYFGYSSRSYRKWPGSEVPPDNQWHGDPEGRGIGPGAAGDQYDRIVENPFKLALGEQAISTFSIDVDTASYANVRQMLQNNVYPPADAVRIEEFVNYFTYDGKYGDFVGDLPGGTSDQKPPFAAQVEVTGCPWEPKHRLVKVGVFGREIEANKRPQSNLVFLVDVSGSMNSREKLPLVIHGMQQLAKELGENDKVAIVVYASSEGLVLPSTPGDQQEKILAALGSLSAGGSTAGGAGITLAYQIAQENFIEGGTNRVILCTDGDFNVGTTSTAELERMVEQKAKETKVFLSVIGFGRGNLNDAMMEKITGIGNGNYYYVDGERETQRVFVKGMTGMLVTIAKDVKIQIEFNPNKVAGYRLLGYENRMLRTEDFNDDTKDAGEIGAGHRVTALYEIVPAGEPVAVTETDEFKYQRPPGLTPEAETGEMLTLKMRYKEPESDTSQKLEWTATDSGKEYGQASVDTRFATAVASFGMLLRDSQYKGNATFDAVHELASAALGSDPDGERSEFLMLVEAAKRLKGEADAAKKAAEEAAKASPQPPVAEPTPDTDPPATAPKVQDATPVAPK